MTASMSQGPAWGQSWRSSPAFIVAAMGMALFTDTFLYTFIVPILPYIIESRLALDAAYTQRFSFALLSESALVAVVLSPVIGHFADKTSTKRIWLLAGLVVVLVGTFTLAVAMSPAVLFIGRFIQAVASSVMWVVSFATIADNVKPEHLGKTYGIISVAVAVGTSAGAMLSGILFGVAGYWVAWSSAFGVILIDIVLRLLMLERPKLKAETNGTHVNGQADSENAPLLQRTDHIQTTPTTRERTGLRFYTTIFRHRRFVCGAVSYLVFALLVSSFDTTLPLHVRAVFGWGSLPTGLLFMALQSPGIPLSPLVGWLKDRVGTRDPIMIGFLLLAPQLWLLGVPGDERFPWASQGDRGPVLYSISVTLIGITMCLLNGAGTMEATMAVDEIETKHPGIFGVNGGYSRALSISSMGWTLGSFIGPILSGFLTEQVGYSEMTTVLGMFRTRWVSWMVLMFAAVISLISSINAYFNLGATWDPIHGTD